MSTYDMKTMQLNQWCFAGLTVKINGKTSSKAPHFSYYFKLALVHNSHGCDLYLMIASLAL